MGIQQKIREFTFPSNPKAKLQRLLNISAIVVGYFYVWTFQQFLNIQVAFIDLSTLLRLPIITVVIFPLVKYGYVKADWLQRGRPTNKSVRFFQQQFPSVYLKDRCSRCIETPQTCRNYIKQQSNDHTSYWLDYVLPRIKREQPEQNARTFEIGYTCKLIFGLQIILLFFASLSVLTVAWKPVVDLAMRRHVTVVVTPLQIIFVLLCIAVAGLLRILNSPANDNPTGCWHAWREINDAHKLWMRNNEPLLVEIICHANGSDKTFAQKQ